MDDGTIKGTGSTVQEANTGAFARTAKAKADKKAGAEPDAGPILTPDNYDVRAEAAKHAAKLGHEIAGWSNAADGVKDFWHTRCVACDIPLYARWRGEGTSAFPDFGSGDPKAYAKPCAGQVSADVKGAGRFAATE